MNFIKNLLKLAGKGEISRELPTREVPATATHKIPLSAPRDTGVLVFLKFSMLGHLLCVDLSDVSDLVEWNRSQRMCKLGRNTMLYEGRVIPLVDYRNNEGQTVSSLCTPRTIVFQVAGRSVGVLVDAVIGVIEVERTELIPPPSLLLNDFDFLTGTVRDKGDELRVIHMERLLGPALQVLD